MVFVRGERVRIKLNSCYRHYLDGLEGEITCVLSYGAVVEVTNPPGALQRLISPPTESSVGRSNVGPKRAVPQQYIFQFHELEKLPPRTGHC